MSLERPWNTLDCQNIWNTPLLLSTKENTYKAETETKLLICVTAQVMTAWLRGCSFATSSHEMRPKENTCPRGKRTKVDRRKKARIKRA